MKAATTVRDQPHYRRDAVEQGLRALGATMAGADQLGKSDVLVIWNRYGEPAMMADRAEKRGVRVIVMENGYLGADDQGRQLYAAALHGHNGSGCWYKPTGVDLAPSLARIDTQTRSFFAVQSQALPADGHILVCGQRGIGTPLMASPEGWHHRMAETVSKVTARPIRIRAHPGRHEPEVPLEQDLAGAALVVVWSSSIAGKALRRGIPVVAAAPYHVLGFQDAQDAREAGPLLRPTALRTETAWRFGTADDLSGLIRLSWAQWTVEEIAAGAAFRMLLDPPHGAVSFGAQRVPQ